MVTYQKSAFNLDSLKASFYRNKVVNDGAILGQQYIKHINYLKFSFEPREKYRRENKEVYFIFPGCNPGLRQKF